MGTIRRTIVTLQLVGDSMRGEVSLQGSNHFIASLILELVDFKVAGIVIYCAEVVSVFKVADIAEHDERLKKVLIWLRDKGIILNEEKCVFHMPKITFMGLIRSQQGVGPTEEKVKAVNEAREPQT